MTDPSKVVRLAASLPARLGRWAPDFQLAWERTQVDPLLLAAVCDRESGGGVYLRPPTPAGTGDGGFGLGLMQIDKRYHPAFVAQVDAHGTPLWMLPGPNILYGAGLLQALLAHFTGPGIPSQLATHCAVAAYNCGIGGTTRGLNSAPSGSSVHTRIVAVDSRTTGHDYSQDVLNRYARFGLKAASLTG